MYKFMYLNRYNGDNMKRRGFTLIELMVIIVVMGIITAIAIPSFRAMNARRGLSNGKALIMNSVLLVKSNAASGTTGWQILFQGGTNNLFIGPIGSPATIIKTLPNNCDFSNAGLSVAFEFYRNGKADSNPADSLSFSIKNNRNESFLFTLIPQIGEVRVDVR